MLREYLQRLSQSERQALKSILAGQVKNFFDESNSLLFSDSSTRQKFDLLAETLRLISNTRFEIPRNGIAYFGKPQWLTSDLLEKLCKEAIQRRNEPLDRTDHYLGCGGKEADALSVSKELIQFVSDHVGPIKGTGIASYIYYENSKSGIKPHVDTDVFSVNLIIMLNHSWIREKSSTVVFPAYEEPQKFKIPVGEIMIMYGGNVIHSRSKIHEGEVINLLTIGFNPI